jgi:sterol desaturase/sphingolipid hydroxylase (fatty acid hydroxylase superfamily)
MESGYAQAVSLAVPVFIALIILEFIVDRWRGARTYRLADSINSLSCGIISTGTRVFFGFIGLFFYDWILNHIAPFRMPASHWGTWLFTFFAYDLCYYWHHRLGHTVGLFWAAHVVHHQSEEFNLTTALRQPGTGPLFGWLFYLPLALCGVPVVVFALTGVIQLFYQFWPHTRHIKRMGFLDRWIQTPSNHRVHHAQNDIYLDRNYVGVFLLWDHLFGTYQDELDEEPCIYGIRGQLKSWNPIWANLHYYAAMAKDSWHAKSWWDKIRVWFAHPGWRPADVAMRYPKTAYDPRRNFELYDPPRNLGLSVYAGLQFLVLMAANSQFLAILPKQPVAVNVVYFLAIVITLVCLGGVLESRPGFVLAEAVRVALIGVCVLVSRAWFGGVTDRWMIDGILLMQALSLAGLAMASRHLATRFQSQPVRS